MYVFVYSKNLELLYHSKMCVQSKLMNSWTLVHGVHGQVNVG